MGGIYSLIYNVLFPATSYQSRSQLGLLWQHFYWIAFSCCLINYFVYIDFAPAPPTPTPRYMHMYILFMGGSKFLPIFYTFIIFTLFYHANRRSRLRLPWCMTIPQYLNTLCPPPIRHLPVFISHSPFPILNPHCNGLVCNAYSIASSHYASGHKSAAKNYDAACWASTRRKKSKKSLQFSHSRSTSTCKSTN